MSKRTRIAGFYAKLEAVSGVAETLAAADLLTVSDLEYTADFQYKESGAVLPYFSNSAKYTVKQFASVKFRLPMYTSGVAGTAVDYRRLFLGCNLAETDGVNEVRYKPLAVGDGSTLTVAYFVDGLLHVLSGTKGTVKCEFASGDSPYFEFTFTGKYAPVADATSPGGTATFKNIPAVTKETTTGLLLGYAACIEKFSFDLGNTITFADRINCATTSITDRKVSNSYEFEMTNVAEKDWFGAMVAQTQAVTQIVYGSVAGSIVTIRFTKDTLSSPSYGDKDGTLMVNATGSPLPTTGDDEFEIIYS